LQKIKESCGRKKKYNRRENKLEFVIKIKIREKPY